MFPRVDLLPNEIRSTLPIDTGYQSTSAREYDLSWQAVNKGYIGNTPTYEAFNKLPLVDEYRFLRKYFHPAWSLYVLGLRLLSLHHPIQELSAYFKNRKVRRSEYLQHPLKYPQWKDFRSTLLQEAPLVSVIIPTLNRYEYLKDVLNDLEKQSYPNFEVLVVDQTEPFQEQFYQPFNFPIRVFQQQEKALWLARNFAIQKAKGNLYLLFDDDSRVEPDWIANHVKCLDFFKADISSGVSISQAGANVPVNYSFFRISDQLDTGNVLIKRTVFEKMGLFDRQFEKQRMGDGEFGLRAFLAGFLNISNPYAGRLHLKVGTGGLRQMGSWDAFRPKSWFAPRPIPSVLYFFRRYYGAKRTHLALLKSVPPSLIPYRFKKRKKMLILGIFISMLLWPMVGIQVMRSWKLASKKIKQGPLISELN